MIYLKDFIPTYHKIGDQKYAYRFTVFTPVYNCEMTIKNVHQSLVNQTFKNFEWLIINDGSLDNSHEVIEAIVETSPLNIHYINNTLNQHKMGCFIEAIALAKGELLLTFDGDDECVPDALEVFNREYLEIPDSIKHKVCAVTGMCQDQHGNRIGDAFPTDPFYSNTFKSQALDGIKGEKWGFTSTSVLKGIHINQQIFSRGLIPEGIIWNLVAKEGYLTKYINKTLRIYHVDVADSLSSTSIEKRAFGSVIHSLAVLNWFFISYFFKTPIFFFKSIYVLLRASKYLPYNLNDYVRAIDSRFIKFFFIVLWPFRRLTL
ncbi:MAG: glycosyltransferase family 2 protein [Aquaticitalea sp.]